MTLLQETATPTVDRPGSTRPVRRRSAIGAEDVVVAVAGIWWASPLTHAIGGRDAGKEGIQLLLLLAAIGFVRPWRRLSGGVIAIPTIIAAAACVIPAVSPTGWRGSDDAAGYVCAATGFIVAAGWARDSVRRHALAGVLCLAGLDQLSQALVPWWGGRDPVVLLTGTFYWHNPFAAFMLPPAILGVGLVTWRTRPWQLVAWVTAPLCTAGVVLSSSRATQAVLAVSWLGMFLGAALRTNRRRLLARLSAITVLTVAVTLLLPGPPLFSHRVSPFAATTSRSTGGQSLGANGGYRLEFWRSSVQSFLHHPLVGSGYHGLVESSRAFTPAGWARSNYAHNGYLQAFSDGGLLLGLPLAIGCLALAWLSLRTLGRFAVDPRTEAVQAVAALGLLAALAHSGVDFDWSHSALFMMDAFLAAIVVSGWQCQRLSALQPAAGAHSRLKAGCLLFAVCAGAGLGLVGRGVANPPGRSEDTAAYASRLAEDAGGTFAGDGTARTLLALSLTDPGSVTTRARRLALDKTADEARIDLDLAAERGRVALTLGDKRPAIAAVSRLKPIERTRPAYAASLGPLLAALGQRQAAEALVRPLLRDALQVGDGSGLPFAQAWLVIEPPHDTAAKCIVAQAQELPSGRTPGCAREISAALG